MRGPASKTLAGDDANAAGRKDDEHSHEGATAAKYDEPECKRTKEPTH